MTGGKFLANWMTLPYKLRYMIFSRFGETKCFDFFSFILLCFFGIFSFIDSRGFIRMLTGAGVGMGGSGTVGEGEERGEVRGEEEERMDGEEDWREPPS